MKQRRGVRRRVRRTRRRPRQPAGRALRGEGMQPLDRPRGARTLALEQQRQPEQPEPDAIEPEPRTCRRRKRIFVGS